MILLRAQHFVVFVKTLAALLMSLVVCAAMSAVAVVEVEYLAALLKGVVLACEDM